MWWFKLLFLWQAASGGFMEGVARRLLPVPKEKIESLLKHSTDGWKFSHFSNLFHFWMIDRVGKLAVARKNSICTPLPPQFSEDLEPSVLPSFKKPGIDRPLCAALRDKLVIWTTAIQIWHDSVIISLLRTRDNHGTWLTGLLFPSPVLIGH